MHLWAKVIWARVGHYYPVKNYCVLDNLRNLYSMECRKGFQGKPPVKFRHLTLQHEPNTLFS